LFALSYDEKVKWYRTEPRANGHRAAFSLPIGLLVEKESTNRADGICRLMPLAARKASQSVPLLEPEALRWRSPLSDFVIAGIGVRPRIDRAAKAGIAVERGVVVNSRLETSAKGVFAAGDIARWPDPHSGRTVRAEHWTVAERQGQTAALNMMGHRERFAAVPLFWSQHYEVTISYVGHAEDWATIAIEGDIAARDCVLRFKREGRMLATASIFRDQESLQAELSMERDVVRSSQRTTRRGT
jgi:hypothetical protein